MISIDRPNSGKSCVS